MRTTNAQVEYLSMLIHYPKMVKYSFIKKEHFTQDFQPAFELIKDSIIQKNTVMDEELIKAVGMEMYLMLTEVYSYGDRLIRSKELQQYIINEWKKNAMINLSRDLSEDVLTVDEFVRGVQNVEKGNKTFQLRRLTKEDYLTTMKTTTSTSLKFRRFSLFRGLCDVCHHDLVVIAGLPGTGKSALAINLMSDLAINYPCLYINMEMSEEQMKFRLMGIESGQEIHSIKRGTADENRMYQSAHDLGQKEIYMVNEVLTLDQIKGQISSLDPDRHFIVFIDHGGLIRNYKAKGVYEKATENIEEIRAMCLNYNCTIFCLWQFNREAAKDKKVPDKSMLRDSGAIEQSATHVILVHSWKDKDQVTRYKLILDKNRSGSRGEFEIVYNKNTQCMSEVHR
ncbi:MAG: DUF2075 domain-containing protein [Erysipelotrichaceae bacterium]|nr:DUF2075 domain-containing protein [Erysipelotrichaceae bacterium]